MNLVQPIRDPAKIEEMKNVLRRTSYRDYFLFVFGINTGPLISDILPLKVKDIKDQNHIILTKKKTKFIINSDLKVVIRDYVSGMAPDDYLFPSRMRGKHLSRIRAYAILKEASIKAGIGEIGALTLRKTFGYHHYKKYKDIAYLQELFHQAAPSITRRFIGLEQDEIDDALRDFSL